MAKGCRAERRVGQALVEFALILPVFLLILLGVLDLGRVFYTYEAIANAAREAARACALDAHNPDGSVNSDASSEVADRVTDSSSGELANNPSIDLDSVTVAQTSPPPTGESACDGGVLAAGDSVTVTVTASFSPLTPTIETAFGVGSGDAVTLSAAAAMMVTR